MTTMFIILSTLDFFCWIDTYVTLAMNEQKVSLRALLVHVRGLEFEVINFDATWG